MPRGRGLRGSSVEMSKVGRSLVRIADEELVEVGGFGEAELGRDGCSRIIGVDEEALPFEDDPFGENLFGGLARCTFAGAGDGSGGVAEMACVVDHIVAVGQVGLDGVAERDVDLGEVFIICFCVCFVTENDKGVEEGDHEPYRGLVSSEAGLLSSQLFDQIVGSGNGVIVEVAVRALAGKPWVG